MVSTFSSGIYSVTITYIKPQDFDWRTFLLLTSVDGEPRGVGTIAQVDDLDQVQHQCPPQELDRLKRASKWAAGWCVVILVTWVVAPMPLYRDCIFNKPFFMGWTVVPIIWLFFCLFVASVYPLVDCCNVLATAGRLAWKSLTGGKIVAEKESGTSTPTSEVQSGGGVFGKGEEAPVVGVFEK